MNGGKKTLTRGVYAIPTSGGAPRQVVGVDAIAAALNIPVSRLPNVLHYDANPNLLDVTIDGGLVAFAATARPNREYLLTVPGGGGTPEVIAGPYSVMTHAAISGDGATLAWGMVRGQSYDAGVLRAGKATELLQIYNETYQALQLSEDGKWLLVGTDGSVYDTDTLVSRPLATPANGQARADTLLSRGMDRASMSSDGKRFLYVLKEIPSNAFEQMATVEIGPESSGDAPLIKGARVDPATITIPTDGSSSLLAVPTIDITWDGELVSLGITAIYAGQIDPNIRGGEAFTSTSASGFDPLSGQGIFTNDGLYYSQHVVREEDAGPRTLRVSAEVKTADGRIHVTALDFGTLTVQEPKKP
jgi:hypothetical protein